MNENIPTIENGSEKILSEREVINALEELAGGDYEIVRREEDEEGIKRLDITTKDENGEMVKFDYTRNDNAGETVIDVVYQEDDVAVGGHPVKKYKQNVWVDVV
jgi:superfamily I DNA and RNA helicase